MKSLSEALLLSDEPRVVTTGQAPHHIVHTNKGAPRPLHAAAPHRGAVAHLRICPPLTCCAPPRAAWSNLTGFKFTEVVNRTNSFLKGPATDESASMLLRQHILAEQQVKVTFINYDREGNPFNNTLECFPLRDANGMVTHYCGVLQGEPVKDDSIEKLDRGANPLPPRTTDIEPDVPG